MTKKFKRILGLFTIILTISPIVVSASFGGWVVTHVEDPVCVTEHCGIWDKTVNSQRYHAYRRCVDGASRVTKERKTYRRHISCGC